MYVKTENTAVIKYPYSLIDLRADHPNTSFPDAVPAETLASYGVYAVVETTAPAHDPSAQVAEQTGCAQNGEVWETAWMVRNKTAEELAAEAAKRARLRQAAYQSEADPLFFKAQRGESTMEAWLAKVAEIKTRFPE